MFSFKLTTAIALVAVASSNLYTLAQTQCGLKGAGDASSVSPFKD